MSPRADILAALAVALTAAPALAQQPEEDPRPCAGDACALIPADQRRPLQVAATPPTPPTPPPPRRPDGDAAGPRLTFGRVFTRSAVADGFYGRFDAEIFH